MNEERGWKNFNNDHDEFKGTFKRYNDLLKLQKKDDSSYYH